MEFDKSRVYTVLNADELEVGSTVIVADSLQGLKDKVSKFAFDENYAIRIGSILSKIEIHRFKTTGGDTYSLAYLISPPEKPEYKPFSDIETAFKIIAEHGARVRDNFYPYVLITGIKRDTDKDGNYEISLQIYGSWHSARAVFDGCIFVDDYSPVGEKIEDSDTEEDGGNE